MSDFYPLEIFILVVLCAYKAAQEASLFGVDF